MPEKQGPSERAMRFVADLNRGDCECEGYVRSLWACNDCVGRTFDCHVAEMRAVIDEQTEQLEEREGGPILDKGALKHEDAKIQEQAGRIEELEAEVAQDDVELEHMQRLVEAKNATITRGGAVQERYRDQVTVFRTVLEEFAAMEGEELRTRETPYDGYSGGYADGSCAAFYAVAERARKVLQSPLDNPAISATISTGRDGGERETQ